MGEQVPVLSIVFMAVSLALSIALPVALLVYFRKKKKAEILPFFVGCAVMILFAFVLEGAINRTVLASSAGTVIQNNIWLLALYGGIMAGIFEETGRLLAFRTVLKPYQGHDANALMYGAGHGGIEAIVILGMTSINNMIYSVLINTGNTAILTDPLSDDLRTQVETVIQTLVTTPSWQFLMGGVERILAVVLQIALSVLVWFAVKKKGRRYLYPVAVLIHFAVDAVTVILSRSGVSIVLVEGMIAAAAIAVALYARGIWRKEAESGQYAHEDADRTQGGSGKAS